MTAVTRSLPCSDIASSLPWSATDWGNRANAEVAALWNAAPILLTGVAGTNDITANATPCALPAYVDGQEFDFVALNNNNGTVRLNVDSLGYIAVNDVDGNPLTSGAIVGGRAFKVKMISSVLRLLTTDAVVINTAPLPYLWISPYGLTISNDSGDTNNYIGISKGSARDIADTQNIVLSSALIKRMNLVWAAGTNQGAILQSAALTGTITVTTNTSVTGSGTLFTANYTVGQVITTAGGQARRITVISSNTAMTVESAWGSGETGVAHKRGGRAKNTKYRVFLIRKDSDGSADVAVGATDTPTDLPAGYSTYRRIWYILTDSSGNNIQFKQFNDRCILNTQLAEATGITSGTVNVNSNAPPGVLANFIIGGTITQSTSTSFVPAFYTASATLKLFSTSQSAGNIQPQLALNAQNYVQGNTDGTIPINFPYQIAGTLTSWDAKPAVVIDVNAQYTYTATFTSTAVASVSMQVYLTDWIDPRN